MSSFAISLRVIRPQNVVVAMLATWSTALLSNGTDWFSAIKVLAAVAMGLGVLGASVFHYGVANAMYSRKDEQLAIADFAARRRLAVTGVLSMAGSIAVAVNLNAVCLVIVVLDALIILSYARFLSRNWTTKNVAIAFTCTSPVLLGWFSGSHLHSGIPYAIGIAFFAYWCREIIKDVMDRRANHGFRLTLPLEFGVSVARKIAAGMLLVSFVFLLAFGFVVAEYPLIVFVPYLCAAGCFCLTAYSLFFSQEGSERREAAWIMQGSSCLILVFFLIALQRFNV